MDGGSAASTVRRILGRQFLVSRVSQLISPKRSWGTIAAEFLVANESRETLKAFLNTVLAELWTERGSAPDWEKLYLRREDYELGIVPAKGSLLVAGVDVQCRMTGSRWRSRPMVGARNPGR